MRVFDALRDLPRPVFLDSGHPSAFAARFDVVAADPSATLTTQGLKTEVRRRDGSGGVSAADPLVLLRAELGRLSQENAEPMSLPFGGGAIGYFGYDLGRYYERIAGSATDDIRLPDMSVGIYDWAVVTDHAEQRSWLVAADRDSTTKSTVQRVLIQLDALSSSLPEARRISVGEFDVLSAVRSNLSRDEYADAFVAVKDHIRRGNCYQVNLTQRFQARVTGDSWQAYRLLRAANPAPYAAYLEFPEGQILSSSPELFLKVDSGRAETRPIKGTRRRSDDPYRDRALADELRASAKDRAENVMIVDLLRNDFGRCCEPGSVRAGPLFEIESFASVHHLVSTVTGNLAQGYDALDLLRACFPGGSITGAPKLASMQIIDELEPHRRGVYCGSIGYVGFDGRMDTNIAIRTLVRLDDQIYAWAGGGIVADSRLEDEYQESFDKAAALLSILEPARPAASG